MHKGNQHTWRLVAISRWKDLEQVNYAGRRAASLFPGLIYWDHNANL